MAVTYISALIGHSVATKCNVSCIKNFSYLTLLIVARRLWSEFLLEVNDDVTYGCQNRLWLTIVSALYYEHLESLHFLIHGQKVKSICVITLIGEGKSLPVSEICKDEITHA